MTSDRFGNPNKAYSFDGRGSYITIPSAANGLVTSSYTISFWINVSDTTSKNDGSEVISDREETSWLFVIDLILIFQM